MGNEIKMTLIATGFSEDVARGRGYERGRRTAAVEDARPERGPRRVFGGLGADRRPVEPSPFDDDQDEIDIPPFIRRRREQS